MSSLFRLFRFFFRNTRGNVAIAFALAALPLTIGVGAGIDYARAYNIRLKLQADLDAALIASVKKISNTDTDTLKTNVTNWLMAQKQNSDATYYISKNDITISLANNTITAKAKASVPATFMSIANVRKIDVAVLSSVVGPSTSYMNVYIVLDKSASMLLAATSAGQTAMKNSQAGCVFACHIVEGGPWTYNGKKYTTNYALAKAMGVTLRADVSVTAAKEVLSMISSADPDQTHIKVGLYTMGGALTEVVAPTNSISTATTALDTDAKKLNSATSEDTSRFDTTVPALTKIVGSAGDGKSAATPLKLVLFLTDGVISQRDWVLNGVWWNSSGQMVGGTDWYKVAPLNPSWCSTMKTSKVTVGVLYTEYLAIGWDQGYIHTVGDTMKSASWTSTWGGTMQAGVPTSTTRRDYIPYALKDCATSSDMFIAASSTTDIEKGLSSLFQIYVGSVKLTQ